MSTPLLKELPAPPAGKAGWPWTEASQPLSETMPGGKRWPKFSVVTPSYNQGEFLEETVRSVLLQGYPNLEYIVIDGGSTDNSVEIIKKYERWLAYWVSEKDKGQSEAVNKGFKRATGEIIGWLNSDDYYEKDIFGCIAERIDPSANRFFLTGDTREFNETTGESFIYKGCVPDLNSLLFHEKLHKAHLPVKLPQQPSTFFHKEVFKKVGFLDVHLNLAMDYDYWLRAVLYGYEFLYLPLTLSHYRFHKSSKSYKGWEGDWDESHAVCKEIAGRVQSGLPLISQWKLKIWWFIQIFKNKIKTKKFLFQ